MTQKELLYFEDAIGHESNVIKIVKNNIDSLMDENLKEFMEEELSKHKNLKEKLLNLLGEKANG